jgi:hypothetical protein
VYGAGRGKGGELFSCETTAGVLTTYIRHSGNILMHGPVFEEDGVACLTISWDATTIAGIAEDGRAFFLHRIDTGERRIVEMPGNCELSKTIAAGPHGCLFFATVQGELYMLTAEGDTDSLGLLPPVRDKQREGARVSSLMFSKRGDLLVGGSDGRLFRHCLQSGECADHGQACAIPYLHALVETMDGRIFGVVGGPEDLAHLVCYDPAKDDWQELGILESHGRFPWAAYRIGPLALGPGDVIYAGENDRFGHLYAYHPAAREAPQGKPQAS